MGPAPAAPGNCVRGLVRVQSLVNLADFRTYDFQLQFRRNVCGKRVLPWLDVLQPRNNRFVLRSQLLVGSILGYGWILNRLSACDGLSDRGCRDLEIQIEIFPKTHNDDSVPRLRDTVFLEPVEVWVDVVTCFVHSLQNDLEVLSLVGVSESAHILCQEPFRLEML